MSDSTAANVPLSSLSPGQKGKIAAIDLGGAERGRVMEMGLTIGTTIEVVKVAPLGDPVEYKVRGGHISLRKKEAAQIQVQRLF
jgi:Fe2+ transport system protein FeoA